MIKKLKPYGKYGVNAIDMHSKINEIIDYLEASKGECMRAGWCDGCNTVHKSPFEDGRYKNPPEHEESWESELKEKLKNGYLYWNVWDLSKFIRTNFVSKEKIKREIEENTYYARPEFVDRKDLLESLGLGD